MHWININKKRGDAMDRFIIEIGMGIDFHGQDVTKAAVKAARMPSSKSCLIGLRRYVFKDNNPMKSNIRCNCGRFTTGRKIRIKWQKFFPVGKINVRLFMEPD